LHKAPNLV